MHGSRSKIPNKKSRSYIYDVKFLALQGAPYIYIHIYVCMYIYIHDIRRLIGNILSFIADTRVHKLLSSSFEWRYPVNVG
jgi:hypothetical protein